MDNTRWDSVTVRPIADNDGIREGDVPADCLHVMCDRWGRIIAPVTVHTEA